MAMYAEEQDIIDRYGLTELLIVADKENTGETDPVTVVQGLTDASDEIDTYLATRYTLPLAVIVPVLKPLCVDIALYKMSTGTSVTEEKRTRYEDAIKLLTKIAKGDVTFGKTTDTPAPAAASKASFTASPRQFSRETMQGY